MASETTWVVIADGAKARIYAHQGRGSGLTAVEELSDSEARKPSRDLGADKPGRSFESADTSRHAMAPRTDWHKEEKHKFLTSVAGHLEQAAQHGRFDAAVLVAPPEALGVLRKALGTKTAERVKGELAKDLTNTPEHDLPAALTDVIAV
jgi:protein required for attachment to host cells